MDWNERAMGMVIAVAVVGLIVGSQYLAEWLGSLGAAQ